MFKKLFTCLVTVLVLNMTLVSPVNAQDFNCFDMNVDVCDESDFDMFSIEDLRDNPEYDDTDYDDDEEGTEIDIDVSVQEEAVSAYEYLIEYFTSQELYESEGLYPDYYGGAYIDGDENLAIYAIDQSELNDIMCEYSVVYYKDCEYSYNELNEIMNLLNEYKLNNPDDDIA